MLLLLFACLFGLVFEENTDVLQRLQASRQTEAQLPKLRRNKGQNASAAKYQQ